MFNITINPLFLRGFYYVKVNENYGGLLCLEVQGSAKSL
ncbi:hypothetical protein AB07_0915 [Citrobacter freundii]|uniref:Uncharacterized protein n=1 Tax=Citrobacter freundii TaxID=546 RepID=A0A7G2ITZ6_CITFR|nr:hypothetical protein AB07_0915 [Citrobacter freundii]CDL40162.1 hypothetical protein [Citrobacter freundii]